MHQEACLSKNTPFILPPKTRLIMQLLLRCAHTCRVTCSSNTWLASPLTGIIIKNHFACHLKHFAAKSWQNLPHSLMRNGPSISHQEPGTKVHWNVVNDNSLSAFLGFVSTLWVQPGLTRDRESRIHFHISFLDITSRLCGWQSVACKLPLNWQCKGAPLRFK